MRNLLRKLGLGRTRPTLDHAYFGKLTWFDFRGSSGYWEAELIVDGLDEPLPVVVNAPESGPDARHVAFCRAALADIDALFASCWVVFESDFEEWAGKPFGGAWRDEFELVGLEVPRDGDDANEWTASWFVDAANHYFTARFVDGAPRHCEIDG